MIEHYYPMNVSVQAVQFLGDTDEVTKLIGPSTWQHDEGSNCILIDPEDNGELWTVEPGDWIVLSQDGAITVFVDEAFRRFFAVG